MFLEFLNYLRQLPLAVRLGAGLALGAVFIVLISLSLNYSFSLPSEARYLPDNCKIYLRVDGKEGTVKQIADKISRDMGFAPIYEAGTGVFSVCNIAPDQNLIFIQSKDKSIEKTISNNGFSFKKIGKGRYIISKSAELIEIKDKVRLSQQIMGKYKPSDDLFFFASSYVVADFNSPLLLAFCEGSDSCIIRGRIEKGHLKLFSSNANSKYKLENATLGDYDYVYKGTGKEFCSTVVAESSSLALPVWAQIVGSDGHEEFLCVDFVLAIKELENATSSSPWQKYKIFLQFTKAEKITADEEKNLQSYLKNSVANLFPMNNEVILTDGSKVTEIVLNPDKLEFISTSSYSYLHFPDSSAVIYYYIDGSRAVISNNYGYLGNPVPEGVTDMLISKPSKINDPFLMDYLKLFDSVWIFKDAIYFK